MYLSGTMPAINILSAALSWIHWVDFLYTFFFSNIKTNKISLHTIWYFLIFFLNILLKIVVIRWNPAWCFLCGPFDLHWWRQDRRTVRVWHLGLLKQRFCFVWTCLVLHLREQYTRDETTATTVGTTCNEVGKEPVTTDYHSIAYFG